MPDRYWQNLLTDLFMMDLPCSSDGKESACNAGDPDSVSGSGRCSGEGNGNPYSCLEKPIDRGAWQATACGVTKHRTWPSDWHYLFMMSSSCSKLFLITWSHTLKINKVACNTVNSGSASWLWRSGITSAEDFTLWRNWQLNTQVTSYKASCMQLNLCFRFSKTLSEF